MLQISRKIKIPKEKTTEEKNRLFGLWKTTAEVNNPEYDEWKQRALQEATQLQTMLVPEEGWMGPDHEAYTFGPEGVEFVDTPATSKVLEHIADPAAWKTKLNTYWGVGKSIGPVIGHNITHGTRAVNPWSVGNRDYGTDEYEPTNKTITKHEFNLIKFAWKYCFNTYRPSKQIRESPNTIWVWFTYYFPGEGHENAGFIRYDPDDQIFILAFRGSQNYHDFADDAASSIFRKIDHACGHDLPIPIDATYAPFLRGKNILSPSMDADSNTHVAYDYLTQAVNGTIAVKTFLITGHSLGGGTAEAAAACLLQLLPDEYFNPVNVYNRNEPRFLLITFEGMRGLKIDSLRDLYNDPRTRAKIEYIDEHGGFRVLNDKDPVPHQPAFTGGATHIGQTILIKGYFNEFMRTPKHDVKNPLALNDEETFDPNRGPHSMVPTSLMLRLIENKIDTHHISDHVLHVKGRGKMRKKRFITPAQRAAMKRRMLYVRSFKKQQ